MNRPRGRLVLLGVAACCAMLWWVLRSPAPDAPISPPVTTVATVATVAATPASMTPALVAPPGPEELAEAELEQMAAMFAAEPALIDALEDATGAADSAVRDDAENFLNALELPAPNPEVAAE